MDGLFKGIEKAHGDLPLMVLDDLSEMFGVSQEDYKMMEGATNFPIGIRARDQFGRTIRE